MKVILVKSVLIERRGEVTVLVHQDDYDFIKERFRSMEDVLSEPLVVSPPAGGEVAPKKKKYIDIFGKEVIKQEDCCHDFLPTPFGCDQCTKCGKIK